MEALRWGAVVGALFGACGVVASALAAHAWSQRLDPAQMALLQRALQFLCFHALALLALAPLGSHGRPRWLAAAAVLFTAGTILFSGSLAGAALAGWPTRLAPIGRRRADRGLAVHGGRDGAAIALSRVCTGVPDCRIAAFPPARGGA